MGDDLSDFEDSLDGVINGAGVSASGDEEVRKHARAQHNALERRRRDNIKAMYGCLENKVAEDGEKLSRAAILKRSIELIRSHNEQQEELLEKKARLQAEENELLQEIAKLESDVDSDSKTPNAIPLQSSPTK